jgi:hypothetical protein
VFFQAYREIFALIRELGIYDKMLWKGYALTYTMAGGQSLEVRTWPLPSPLRSPPAVFTNTSTSLAGKLALARAPPSTALTSFIALVTANWSDRPFSRRRREHSCAGLAIC